MPVRKPLDSTLVLGSLEGSIAPTLATSPEHSPAKEAREDGEGREEAIQQQPGEEDGMVEGVEQLSVSATPQSPGEGVLWEVIVAWHTHRQPFPAALHSVVGDRHTDRYLHSCY